MADFHPTKARGFRPTSLNPNCGILAADLSQNSDLCLADIIGAFGLFGRLECLFRDLQTYFPAQVMDEIGTSQR